jgi:hypothetical protein
MAVITPDRGVMVVESRKPLFVTDMPTQHMHLQVTTLELHAPVEKSAAMLVSASPWLE